MCKQHWLTDWFTPWQIRYGYNGSPRCSISIETCTWFYCTFLFWFHHNSLLIHLIHIDPHYSTLLHWHWGNHTTPMWNNLEGYDLNLLLSDLNKSQQSRNCAHNSWETIKLSYVYFLLYAMFPILRNHLQALGDTQLVLQHLTGLA